MDDVGIRGLEAWKTYASEVQDETTWGVRLYSLENPGWALEICLEGTPLHAAPFDPVRIDRSETDWIQCRVEDGVFKGYGGVRNLLELVTLFLVHARARGVSI